jgi:hypothetical protein
MLLLINKSMLVDLHFYASEEAVCFIQSCCLPIVHTMYRLSWRDPRSHPPTREGISLKI